MSKENAIFDVLIIGGGIAGLTCAIHLSKYKLNVLVIEKNSYPKHKVCGEYISNEVLPYLKFIDFDPFKLGAKRIDKFELTTPKNKLVKANLPLGGFGISRYTLDDALAKKAKKNGVIFLQDLVTKVQFKNDLFSVTTKTDRVLTSKLVIGAFGKRSNMDIKLNRKFIKKESPYLAVKTHLKGDFPDNLVALHNFEGGYCGFSKVENDAINACYIVEYAVFKKYKNIEVFQEQVLYKNKALKKVYENSTALFDQPITISQISFSSKNPVEDHMLMCGDTAGMIHPLCGNGMSMAIRSAQMASQLIIPFMVGDINRRTLEKRYKSNWNNEFEGRLKTGHIVASLFRMRSFSEIIMLGLKYFPKLLPQIIKRTHGKPLTINRMSFLVNTAYRTDQEEIMDDFSLSGDILDNTLDTLATINKWLGGNQVTLSGLKDMLKDWPKDKIVTIIDLGCGGGDMLRLIANYGRKHGYKFQLVGIDANPYTIAYAKKCSKAYSEITFSSHDVFSKEFKALKFDLALATLFLHHFKSDEILGLLSALKKKASMGVLVNDLHRHRLAYYLFKIITLPVKNRMIKEDGQVSILRGFKRKELIQISKELKVESTIKWRWAFRFQWILK